jgi:hypothetical protein
MSQLPPIEHNPPDYLSVVAEAIHESWQLHAPDYAQDDSGTRWKAMPLNYRNLLRHVVLDMLERGVVLQNWHR